MPSDDELRPVCFIAMPFGQKRVTGARDGAPNEVDFNALWDKVYRPAIDAAGYTPVRADFDTGSVIIKDMVERLAYADMVIADVSLQNGNVYYEVGLRHAARDTGCVLFGADWSRQLFDIDQFTTVRYPLKDGAVTDEEAAGIRDTVRDAIVNLGPSKTPWYVYVDDPKRGWSGGDQTVFRKEAARLSAFQADLQAIRLEPNEEARKKQIREKMDSMKGTPALKLPQAVVEMIVHIRDQLGDWQALLDFIGELDPAVRDLPFVEEQRLLAVAKTGDNTTAIAHMEKLIELRGPTPERLGIIGGRYKRLWRAARKARLEAGGARPTPDERRYLKDALDYYERGMKLDFNEYYCSCNVPPLLLARGKSGDAERARSVDHLVVAACNRAIERGEDDGWTRPTLLGAAFRASEEEVATELVDTIAMEGTSKWKLDTTIEDMEDLITTVDDDDEVAKLQDILQQLRDLK